MKTKYKLFPFLRGFTLIEVAISLIVFGIILGFGIPTIKSLYHYQKAQDTKERQNQLLAILAAYALKEKRLPCPSDPSNTANLGLAQTSCYQASQAQGIVPYKTLGLSPKMAKDGHNNWFTYAVSPDLTQIGLKAIAINPDSIYSEEETFCGVTVETKINIYNNPNQNETMAKDIALVILSHGPSGEGAYKSQGIGRIPVTSNNQSKFKNSDGDLNFVDLSSEDELMWITRDNLVSIYGRRPCKINP